MTGGTFPSDNPRFPCFDQAGFLERTGGDLQFARTLIDLFRQDYVAHRAAIRTAVEHGDGEQLRIAAHSLKGCAGLLSAARVKDAARVLEELGRDGALGDAAEALNRLEHDVNDLLTALSAA